MYRLGVRREASSHDDNSRCQGHRSRCQGHRQDRTPCFGRPAQTRGEWSRRVRELGRRCAIILAPTVDSQAADLPGQVDHAASLGRILWTTARIADTTPARPSGTRRWPHDHAAPTLRTAATGETCPSAPGAREPVGLVQRRDGLPDLPAGTRSSRSTAMRSRTRHRLNRQPVAPRRLQGTHAHSRIQRGGGVPIKTKRS
jgi:hypothetical protein